MKLRSFEPEDIGELAYAVYCKGQAVFRSPAHRAYFSEKDIPAIPEDDRRVYYLETPFPHLAARNCFSLGKERYTLFTLLPLAGEAEQCPAVDEDDAAIRPVRELFSTLLAFRDPHEVFQGVCAVNTLFADCCAAIRGGITDALDIVNTGKISEDAFVLLAREGLLLSLGIAVPHLSCGRRITAEANVTTTGEHTFSFLSGCTVENAFLRRFIQAVAEACGFSVSFPPDGICFTMRSGHPSTLALHASLPVEDSYYIALGLLLSGVAHA